MQANSPSSMQTNGPSSLSLYRMRLVEPRGSVKQYFDWCERFARGANDETNLEKFHDDFLEKISSLVSSTSERGVQHGHGVELCGAGISRSRSRSRRRSIRDKANCS